MLMTLEQACAYLGGMDDRTFRKVCPVQPVEMAANLLRYRRPDIDDWTATLTPRLKTPTPAVNDSVPTDETTLETPEIRRESSIERVKARTGGLRHGRSRRTP
ncbi:hypothetical protein ABI_15080 [Asticcacaulis biprosthecium C19]|uniref:Uncharacterized protein n=1 Tax=Asticcacaulis biprosthecium C19 TaxID=715226 RepID=F4QJ05_9CAUL|nr:hypothetical protein [Asticcacaulis biprosthecium]EGF93068.1 hypothetical protein ABI_15080 [Asticcacaulis biprosthecium C19]